MADSKDRRVRVEASKNRLAEIIPRQTCEEARRSLAYSSCVFQTASSNLGDRQIVDRDEMANAVHVFREIV
jgi:hypothetical protein